VSAPPALRTVASWSALLGFGYLFFLAIELVSAGMKGSFAEPLKLFLAANAGEFTELRSFVIGILGTALAQSSSAVTSMSVVLAQEGVMPLLIAAGIVHGANLGTSVTSSIVAFASDAPKATGNLARDAWRLLTRPRGDGFRRAVGAAVVHDFFNIIMVTAILVFLELPFGWVLYLSERSAELLEGNVVSSHGILAVTAVLSPSTWTRPISGGLFAAFEALVVLTGDVLPAWVPGFALVLIGLPLLFVALKGFTGRMKSVVLTGLDLKDLRGVGDRLLGRSPADTFLRGLILTILVQSSSATTSMVVPLAALGLFEVRRIFPFILGANLGTTFTALIAATSAVGQPGFHEGMTIALCHLYLNGAAVLIAAVVVGLPTSVIGSAEFLAEHAERRPWVLLAYLGALCIGAPLVVYVLPDLVAAAVLSVVMLFLLVGPHVYIQGRLQRKLAALGVSPHEDLPSGGEAGA